MKSATPLFTQDILNVEQKRNESAAFSSESVLNILKLILDGSELPEVLMVIARLIESLGHGTFCTVWLPDADGKPRLSLRQGW